MRRGSSGKSRLEGGGGIWAREIGTICPFGVFFPCFIASFWPNLRPIHVARPVCGVVTFSLVLYPFQVGFLCSWNPTPNPPFVLFGPENGLFKLPKHCVLKGKMANFEAKNTLKQGKNAKGTNGTHFMRVRGGGSRKKLASEVHRATRGIA